MKIQTLFLVTHAIASVLIAALVTVAVQFGSPLVVGGSVILSVVILVLVSRFASTRISTGLLLLESVIADNEAAQGTRSRLTEFDQCAIRIGAQAERWEGVAATSREQAGDLRAMMKMLNSEEMSGESNSRQLRELLAGLGNLLHAHLMQIEKAASEIRESGMVIANGAEKQGHVVVRTISHVEQLTSAIDSVCVNSSSATEATEIASESASAAIAIVGELKDGMKRVQAGSQASEKKLRGLCDPSRQISEIVETINDITAKTDLLALNASIESIRATEHGGRFAIVADEVRKNAEQTADATREIESLIESMQIVTDESIRRIASERTEVQTACERVAAIEEALQQICAAAELHAQHVQEITTSSNRQLQLAQDVILAVEEIALIAKGTREDADAVSWTMKSLSETASPFAATIDRLRDCSDRSPSLAHRDVTEPTPAAELQPILGPIALAPRTS